MAVINYTPDNTKIIHNTRVDFSLRKSVPSIHIVQYDTSLPIVKVDLYLGGQPYAIPANADLRVRVGKKDKTYVYKDVLGCTSDRRSIYFEIDDQMTIFYGDINPILDLVIKSGEVVRKAGSSPIYITIDRNPVQDDYKQSTTSNHPVDNAVEIAEKARDEAIAAKDAAVVAKTGSETARNESLAAKVAAEAARDISVTAKNESVTAKTQAETARNEAKASQTAAKTSETNSKASETASKTSETNAATSASSASGSASTATAKASEATASAAAALASQNASKTSETNSKTSETNAKASETAAKTSETNAKTSQTSAAGSASTATTKATEASNSAATATTKATEASNSAAAALASQNAAKTSETNSKTSETNAKASELAAKASELNTANKLQTTQADLQYGKIYRGTTSIPYPDSGAYNVDIVIRYPDGWNWGFVEVEIFKNYSYTSYTGYIKRSWLLNRGINGAFSNSEISTIIQGDIGAKVYVDDIVRVNETTDVISLSAKNPEVDGYGIIVRLVSLDTKDISIDLMAGGRQSLETRTNVNTYVKMSDLDNKLDKVTHVSDLAEVYIKNIDGTKGMASVSYGLDPYTIAQRDGNNQFHIGNATVGTQPIPMGQADNRYVLRGITLGMGTDLNTVTETGFYWLTQDHTNIPSGGGIDYAQMIVSRVGDTVAQIIMSYNQPKFFYRAGHVNYMWERGWQRVLNENDLNWTLIATDNSIQETTYITIPSGYRELYILSSIGGAPVLLSIPLINRDSMAVQSLSGFKSSTVGTRVLNPIATWYMSSSTYLRKRWVNGEYSSVTFYIYGR